MLSIIEWNRILIIYHLSKDYKRYQFQEGILVVISLGEYNRSPKSKEVEHVFMEGDLSLWRNKINHYVEDPSNTLNKDDITDSIP